MDLLLIRCAEMEIDGAALSAHELATEAGTHDAAPALSDPISAALSERGERHSRRLAAWLAGHAPRQLQIFSSPAKGARQMAGLLAEGIGGSALPPLVSRLLGPSAQAADVLGAVGWPHDHSAALVVAHQPALGALASLLLCGQEAPLAVKKGALWWFSSRLRGGEEQTVLRCALSPDLIKGGGRSAKAAAGEVIASPTAFGLAFPPVADLVRLRLSGPAR